jgi:hypothetical protein
MTLFEGRRLPDTVNWPAQLDRVFTKPYDVWYGDARPLDWVVRYVKEHPSEIPAIAAALEEQLRRNDPEIRSQIFEQLPYMEVDLSTAIGDLIVRERDALHVQQDPCREGQTLLGAAVRALDHRGADRHQLSDAAVRTLAEIGAPEDGYPESFLVAVTANLDACLPSLASGLAKLDSDAVATVARRLAELPPAQCERAFSTIGQETPTYVRKRLARAIKVCVEPNRWPAFSTWLRV